MLPKSKKNRFVFITILFRNRRQNMSKRSGKSVPIPKPTWTIPADWLEIHPVENHAKLQADVNRLLVAESKLAKKIKNEEDQNKAARIVRDHLAKARVLLVLLSPNITISEAHQHPLVNGECSFFASRFSISIITGRFACIFQCNSKKGETPCSAAPVVGCQYGMFCEDHKTSHENAEVYLIFLLRIYPEFGL